MVAVFLIIHGLVIVVTGGFRWKLVWLLSGGRSAAAIS